MSRSRCVHVFLIAVLVLPAAAISPVRATEKPNVVLIMTDDMGYECVGADGSKFYRTPNLDVLGRKTLQAFATVAQADTNLL